MNNDDFQRMKADYLKRQSEGTNNPVLILVAGIIVIVIGYFLNNTNQAFLSHAGTTTATLEYERNTSKEFHDSEHKDMRHYDVYATYTVDGKEYREFLESTEVSGLAAISIQDGKTTTIYYDLENPSKIISKRNSSAGIFVMGFGGLVVALAVFYIIYSLSKGRKLSDNSLNQEAAEKFADKMENFLNKNGIIDDDKQGKI
jgi:hypothetical protein